MKEVVGSFSAAIGLFLIHAQGATGQPAYSVVPIYPVPESQAYSTYGLDINDAGHVVGGYSQWYMGMVGNNQIRSFFYSDATGTLDLWPESGTSIANGINSSGQVALYGGDFFAPFQAYRYTPGVGFEPLGSFGGPEAETTDINDLGQVTGFSDITDGHSMAFRYTDGVGLENIGSSFTSSVGLAINDQGWVTGVGDGNAFLFRDDVGTIDLGPGRGRGINNLGTVVGEAFTPFGTFDAFIYEDGQFRRLQQAGLHNTILTDINDAGVAVGLGINNLNQGHALIWTEATGFIDLNSLIPEDSGWTLFSATAINEVGQITGTASFNGLPIPFRLDPIPEPSTWCLLGLGGLFGWVTYRRGKRCAPPRARAGARERGVDGGGSGNIAKFHS